MAKTKKKQSRVTAGDIFDITIRLIDEQDSDGASRNDLTEDYRHRFLGILNMLLPEIYLYSDYRDPDDDNAWRIVERLCDSLLWIDDALAVGILPYGIAANLLVEENPSKANFYQQRYEALLAKKEKRMKADIGEIEDLYGGIEYGHFSQW